MYCLLPGRDDYDDGIRAIVKLYILARTDKDVVVHFESPSDYVKKVIMWDNEKKDVLQDDYEDLSQEDIL